MARPKLSEDQKKISVSFTLEKEFHNILLARVPVGERSGWICEVVTNSLKHLHNEKILNNQQ